MAPILLIHGSFHGAWCWAKIVPLLARQGRKIVAIDLPGAGDDPANPDGVTLDSYLDAIDGALVALGEPAILVGHSIAGMWIAAAAEKRPELIARLVYVCAVVPRDGDSYAAIASTFDPAEVTVRVAFAENGLTAFPEEDSIVPAFYADCGDQDVAFAKQRLRPVPVQPVTTPLNLSDAGFGRVPSTYVVCLNDRTIPPSYQLSAARDGRMAEVRQLASSHSPFFSRPEELAHVIAEL